MFKIGAEYSKKDIYKILNVPDHKQGGAWDTGYRLYNEEIFLFVNVGAESRTGVNHDNYFENDLLVWHGKRMSHIKHPLIKRMVESDTKIHGFCRNDSRSPFTYFGIASQVHYEETTPIKIIWKFNESIIKESVNEIYNTYYEGFEKNKYIKVVSRSIEARNECIKYYGCSCQICGFDFEKVYGCIGSNYIQVHHLNPISTFSEEHSIDPLKDLMPVCPNCHAMIHRKAPPYTINQIKLLFTGSSQTR